MINDLHNALWQAMYLNPVFPDDLLKNVKDQDYTNVAFIPTESGCIVELAFYDEGEFVEARYIFDEEDRLQKALMYETGHESIIYDRDVLVNEILSKLIIENRKSVLIATA